MINRQLSRLLLCSILGSTTLISGCAWYVRILRLINSSNRNKSNLLDDIHLASSGHCRRSGGNNSMTRSWMP